VERGAGVPNQSLSTTTLSHPLQFCFTTFTTYVNGGKTKIHQESCKIDCGRGAWGTKINPSQSSFGDIFSLSTTTLSHPLHSIFLSHFMNKYWLIFSLHLSDSVFSFKILFLISKSNSIFYFKTLRPENESRRFFSFIQNFETHPTTPMSTLFTPSYWTLFIRFILTIFWSSFLTNFLDDCHRDPLFGFWGVRELLGTQM